MKRLIFSAAFSLCVFFCVAQSGTYFPVATSSVSTINPIAQRATYVQTDSVVIVYGTVFLNGFPVPGSLVKINLTVPVPSDFTVPPSFVYGLGEVFQAGPSAAAQVSSDFIPAVVVIRYTPTVSQPAKLFYHFSYIVH